MADANDAEVTKPKTPLEWGNEFRDIVKPLVDKDDDEEIEDKPEDEEVDDTSADADEEVEDVDDDDTEGEEKTDDEAEDKEDDSKSKVRFSQYKGDGKPETYIKNLENAYSNSTQEAIKLKDTADAVTSERDNLSSQVEAIKTAVAKDPEFAEKVIALLDEASKNPENNTAKTTTDSDNPYVRDAQTRWEQENSKSAEEFAERNPEVLDDPVLAAKVKGLVKQFGAQIYADEHRLPQAGELMEKAYGYLGLDVKKSEKQELVDGMKKVAAPTRKQTPSKKPKATAKQFSGLTMDISKKMGISKERLEKGGKR